MGPTWVFKTSPSPPLIPYNDLVGGNHHITRDIWITPASLNVLKHIPGVPAAYADEERTGLVLYIRGIPFGITSEVIKDMFMPFGKVNKAPMLICLGSGQTFRWVVMKHADDAKDARRALHGSAHEGGQLFVSMAMGPGKVFELQGQELPYRFWFSSDNNTYGNGAVGHAHPSPPAVQPPKLLLPPIPRIAVPAIAHLSAQALRLAARPVAQQATTASSQQASVALPVQEPAYPVEQSESSTSSGDTTIKAVSPVQATSTQVSSWANIASSSDPLTRVIELHPTHKRTNLASRLNRVGRIPSIVVPAFEEPLADQMRLIFLLNLPNTIDLAAITSAVNEGPLVRIHFGNDNEQQPPSRFVGIIFQWAEHADAFYNALIEEREKSRPRKFRFLVEVVKGDPVPTDHIIHSMSHDPWATRRLTIVKGGFFFMFCERQLKEFCYKIAGEENVQKVWLYNGGNATVVFADVESAIKVKNSFDKRANDSTNDAEFATWKGLQTTFSKDPCIHQVDFKTAM
ncbi:hypothetical protein WAI453_011437 [Rhynchosporium graminicola]|uniref:RRM domain-containing protein n=1 Tax=Rhynchosporium graminicola TaxID=2792576 RepID=A0A1E1L1J0_9HELO|nr:uncharacterized protein RCO7_10042 [Rhynchosporium commune]